MSGRKALGRGLDALIPGAQTGPGLAESPSDSQPAITGTMVLSVPIGSVVPNPRQPRGSMNDESLGELAESIRDRGILEPLLVRGNGDGTYELIAGERRLRAAARAGLTEVPVIEKEMGDLASLEVALIENVQREDLNAVDEARAYQRLVEEFGRTHAEISRAVGKNRATVTNTLRLLVLPHAVLEHVSRGTLSAGHARALLRIEDPKKIAEMAERVVSEGWTVRQVEKATAEAEQPVAPPERVAEKVRDPQVVRVEEALRRSLGTDVRLLHTPKGGRIEIRYFSSEELERILEHLRVDVY